MSSACGSLSRSVCLCDSFSCWVGVRVCVWMCVRVCFYGRKSNPREAMARKVYTPPSEAGPVDSAAEEAKKKEEEEAKEKKEGGENGVCLSECVCLCVRIGVYVCVDVCGNGGLTSVRAQLSGGDCPVLSQALVSSQTVGGIGMRAPFPIAHTDAVGDLRPYASGRILFLHLPLCPHLSAHSHTATGQG